MLFDLIKLSNIYKIPKTRVLHVGAHEGEEAEIYKKLDWVPVIWVEAQPKLVNLLRTKLDPNIHEILEAAVWDSEDVQLTFHIASNSQSSSLLEFGTHALDYPGVKYEETITVKTRKLSNLLENKTPCDFMNLDVQGVEGRAISGMEHLLSKVNYIYTEVNKKDVYINCTLVKDLDKFLISAGFVRACTRWVPFKGWGDALYIRKSELNFGVVGKVKMTIYQTQYYLFSFFRIIVSRLLSKISMILR